MAACTLTKTEIKEISALHQAFEEARTALYDRLNDLCTEWQDEFDQRSDNWRDSAAGSEAQDRLTALEETRDAVESAELDLSDIL